MERQEVKAIMRQYKEYLQKRFQHETDPLFNRFKAQNDIRAFNYVIEFLDRKTVDDLTEEEVNNLMRDLQISEEFDEVESMERARKELKPLIDSIIKDCKEEEKKAEQDKVTQWIKDNADFIKEMARMLEDGRIQG